MRPEDLIRFKFKPLGSYGRYFVTYITPKRGDSWMSIVKDTLLIDATKNAEHVKVADLKRLRKLVIQTGHHYSKYGRRIY